LSSPVVYWYTSYFSPGHFEAGFDTWLENKKFENNNSKFTVDLNYKANANKLTSVVACMNPSYSYEVKWNGKSLNYKTLAEGTLNIDIPIEKTKKGKLEIIKK